MYPDARSSDSFVQVGYYLRGPDSETDAADTYGADMWGMLLQKPDGRGGVIRTCPHGRPVAFEIKKTAMDRQFGRLE